jgi:hypothetical protein
VWADGPAVSPLEQARLLEVAEVPAHAGLGDVQRLAQVGDPDGFARFENAKDLLLPLLREHSTPR